MADVFTNDLRIREQEVGANSGAWGGYLNTSLENIAEAFSYGTEALADSATQTLTLADGASDELRSLYLKLTGTLSQATTVTLAPNTISKCWIIENATTGGYDVTISQGSGANVTVGNSKVKMIATDGAGSGGVVYDLLTDLELAGQVTIADLTATTADINGGTIDSAVIGGTTPAAGSFTTVSVDNITIDGTEIDLSSGDLTVDVAGDIILDADSGAFRFKDAGTTLATFTSDSGSMVLYNATSDKDLIFKGNDGGSTVTALTFDMSDAGAAQFNSRVGIGVAAHATAGLNITSTYQNIRLNNGSELGIIDVDSDGHLILWAHGDGETIDFKTGSSTGTIAMSVVGTNVGIGTASPAYETQIYSADDTVLSVVSGDSNSASLYLGDAVATRGRLTYDNSDDSLAIYTDNNERMRITSSAHNHVAIGSSSVTDITAQWATGAVLDIHDSGSSNTGSVILSNDLTTNGSGIGSLVWANRNNSNASGATNTAISSISASLTTSDSNSGDDSGGYLRFFTKPEAGSLSERMRITSGGLWFLGKTSSSLANTGIEIHPSGVMYATSTDLPQCYLNRENTHGVQLQGRKDNSNVWSISTNSNSLASDRNFKKDITDLQLGLDFVKELKPKTFRFKMDKETDPLMTGLIAQDLEQSLTDAGVEKNSMTLVQHEPQEDESESQYMVDYSKLIPVLIKGMQEQQALIETLEAKVKALEEA